MLFTLSFDDGYRSDLRVAALLDSLGMRATFYVCPVDQHGVTMLTKDDLRTLVERHEIGAHTLTHPRLTRLSQTDALEEIRGSKEWVEGVIGRACTSFCYPKGDTNDAIRAIVADAGFSVARTTDDLRWDAPDSLACPTTLQISPFPVRRRITTLKHVIDPFGPLRVKAGRLWSLGIPLRDWTGWGRLARALFIRAVDGRCPFFHLWGHSREIEFFGMWDEFAAFLRFIHEHRFQVSYGANRELSGVITGAGGTLR